MARPQQQQHGQSFPYTKTYSARSPSHIATSSRNVAGSTLYQTGGHVLMAIKGISKKQDEMLEKLLDLERKVLSFMQDSFDITKVSYYVRNVMIVYIVNISPFGQHLFRRWLAPI